MKSETPITESGGKAQNLVPGEKTPVRVADAAVGALAERAGSVRARGSESRMS